MPPTVLTRRKSNADEWSALRHLALTDLYGLSRYILYRDSPTPLTREFHGSVCSWGARSPFQRNLYLLSRDHLKTSVFTVAKNVQRFLKRPDIRILLAADKAETAQGMLAEIKGHCNNEYLKWLFPEVLFNDPYKEATQWSQSAISVKRKRETKEATIETIGVEGASTGKHYEHGSFDDLVDEQNSKTRDLLEKTIHWYQTAQSLFEPGATQDIVGTNWEFGDLYDWMIQQKIAGNFRVGIYRQPCWRVRDPGTLRLDDRNAIAEDDFLLDASGRRIPAYGEKHTYESLEERRRVNPRLFAAQWLLRPTDDSAAVFPRGKAVVKNRAEFPPLSEMWIVTCVDPAISTREWADYSAIATMGFHHDGKAYVLDLRRGRWEESKLVDEVYDNFERIPGVTSIGFEAVGFQKLYFREFARAAEVRKQYLPVGKLERDTKIGKNIRIRSLQPLWDTQSLVFASDLPALNDFLEEAERFRPWKESLHDDMLDALADCLQARVQPAVPDPDEGLEHDVREEKRIEREIEALRPHGAPSLDRGSMRQARLMRHRLSALEQDKERTLAGAEAGEFYGV